MKKKDPHQSLTSRKCRTLALKTEFEELPDKKKIAGHIGSGIIRTSRISVTTLAVRRQ